MNVENKLGHTPLSISCYAGSLDTANVLVAAGASIHAPGRHEEGPLYRAIEGCQLDVIEWLQSQSAHIHPDQVLAAVQAVKVLTGGTAKLNAIADAMLPPDVDREALWAPGEVFRSVWRGHVDEVRSALADGTDANQRLLNGRTLLMHCWKREMAKLLIENGADLNARDNLGRSVLTWVKHRPNRDLVSALIEAGAIE